MGVVKGSRSFSECLNDQVDGICVMMGVVKVLCGCGQMYASFPPKYLLPEGNHWYQGVRWYSLRLKVSEHIFEMSLECFWYHFACLVITNVAVILTSGQSVILALFFDWEIYFTPYSKHFCTKILHTVLVTY